jgi:hypothetical protein
MREEEKMISLSLLFEWDLEKPFILRIKQA